MNEKQFTHKFMAAVTGHKTRIENAVSFGMPDLLITIDGIDVFVEMKVAHDGKILTRATQYSWHAKRYVNKAAAFILALDGAVLKLWSYPFAVVVHAEKVLQITSSPQAVMPYSGPGMVYMFNLMKQSCLQRR